MNGKRNFMPGLLLIVASIIFLGCGGARTLVLYQGEQRPVADVATIDISQSTIYVMSIDTIVRKYAAISEDLIKVLPGQHRLEANYYKASKGKSAESLILEFNALAGHNYKVKARSNYPKWYLWVLDMADSSIVAGSPTENGGRMSISGSSGPRLF